MFILFDNFYLFVVSIFFGALWILLNSLTILHVLIALELLYTSAFLFACYYSTTTFLINYILILSIIDSSIFLTFILSNHKNTSYLNL